MTASTTCDMQQSFFSKKTSVEDEDRIDVRDYLEVGDNKVQPVCKAPNMVERGRDDTKLSLNQESQMPNHPICRSHHVSCTVSCDPAMLRKRNVHCFETVEQKLSMFLSCCRQTHGKEEVKLLNAIVENKPGNA